MAGSGVWQDYQSLPTRTLHQRIEPHDGQKNDYAPHSLHSTTPFTPFTPLSVHPHVGMVVCSPSCTGIFFVDLTHPGGEPLIGRHSRFSTEWSLVCFPSIFWGLVQVSLMHRLGDCIFFPSVVCVSFPGDFIIQDELLFSPCCELCLLIHFETV